jgi:pseudaminic acid synthase
MKIGQRSIGGENKVFIIAELSANHNQQKEIAIATIRAAKKAGADAIKLQTYTPDTLTIDCDNQFFQINQGTLWDGRTLYGLYKDAYTPWEWHNELFNVAKEENLICFSSPFDLSAVDFLNSLNVPAYKIASFEIQDVQLIAYAASKGKPMIISTGIAEEDDIQLAIKTCYENDNRDIVLLKCTSSYPAPVELANLYTMVDMKTRFGVEIGLSDHTLGETVPIVATALGAKVIEKHFILDKALGGPDAEFSMDPNEFKKMVDEVRRAELSLGAINYEIPNEVKTNRKFARSIFVIEDITEGGIITKDNVKSIRPGYGLHPKFLNEIIGKSTKVSLKRGTPLKLEHINL